MRAAKIVILRGLLVILFCAGSAGLAQAATYYVRMDGGSSTQCNGLSDAAYPGSGTGRPCAFNHPNWALAPQGNNPTKLAGGDTLIIDGADAAQYLMGLGSPNTGDTSKCHSSLPWDCILRPIPSGPDPTRPTRILGKGWDKGCASPPQLWGRERLTRVINMAGSSNVELQCLEITDHSDCQDPGPKACNRSSYPYGNWADHGIYAADSSNVLLKNVNIHGMAHSGIHSGRLKDWTLQDTKIVANAFVGWDGDIGANSSSNSGTMMFDRVTIAYNGCGETYPGKVPYNCFSQAQGGYGDGLGMATTGGRWVFQNSNVSHNTSDGIDLLYHTGSGEVAVLRTRAEGNAGNQVKTAAKTYISNSIIIGNCGYFKNNPITWSSGTFDHCRATGNAVSIKVRPGMQAEIYNSTVLSNGDTLILSSGSGCTGGETIKSRNNIFIGRPDFWQGDQSVLYYAGGSTGNADGACAGVKFDDNYSVIYGTRGGTADCSGKPNAKCSNPLVVETLSSFYTGNAFNANLQSASPAANSAQVMTGYSSLDYNKFDRGSTWDIGALERGSIPNTSQSSSSPPVNTCGNGVVDSGEQCDGGSLKSQTCLTLGFVSGTLGCTSSCTFNTSGCSRCGNGSVDPGEQCDGGNLSGQTCVAQGFAGGNVGCTSACTLNTSGCSRCWCP